MEIIIPCAGMSSRFPNLRPKYLLTDYKGLMMVENSAKQFIGKYNVTLVILETHDKQFNASQKLKEVFGDNINIIILPEITSGPAETVYKALKIAGIDEESPIFIKDCDSYFDCTIEPGNNVYVSDLKDNPHMHNTAGKSYTLSNNQGIITSIVEKQIVSSSFCVGGYQFGTARDFIKSFEALYSNSRSEIYVSNVIDYLILNGAIFIEQYVTNFIDIGTAPEWFEYNNRPTYFCDIDGTIIKSTMNYYEPYIPLTNNINKLKSEMARGCKIIFCTARGKQYKNLTMNMLDELGFGDCDLIMEVHHSKRVVINDYANSNPYPTAIAVNIARDSDNLGDFI